MLAAQVVIVVNKRFHSLYKLFVSIKMSEIVHLTFQNAPEAFHGTVINTSSDARHTLFHVPLIQFFFELLACILKSAVTVKQRVGIRILLNR